MENKICAVIDAQGFQIGQTFFPRELAIIGKNVKLCYEIVSESVKFQNRGKLEFQTNAIHGIPINQVLNQNSKCFIKEENLDNFLKFIVSLLTTEKRKYVAVKNQQLCQILTRCSIDFINLEKHLLDFQPCPPLRVFEKIGAKNSVFCPLHLALYSQNFDKDVRCSLKKALFIWEWVNRIRQTTIAHEVVMSSNTMTSGVIPLDLNILKDSPQC